MDSDFKKAYRIKNITKGWEDGYSYEEEENVIVQELDKSKIPFSAQVFEGKLAYFFRRMEGKEWPKSTSTVFGPFQRKDDAPQGTCRTIEKVLDFERDSDFKTIEHAHFGLDCFASLHREVSKEKVDSDMIIELTNKAIGALKNKYETKYRFCGHEGKTYLRAIGENCFIQLLFERKHELTGKEYAYPVLRIDTLGIDSPSDKIIAELKLSELPQVFKDENSRSDGFIDAKRYGKAHNLDLKKHGFDFCGFFKDYGVIL